MPRGRGRGRKIAAVRRLLRLRGVRRRPTATLRAGVSRRMKAHRGGAANRRYRGDDFRITLQAGREEATDFGWRTTKVRYVFDDRGEDLRHVGTLEKPAAGKEFVENDAESPNIGAFVDGFTADLFGRHVSGGAENPADSRHGEGFGGRDFRIGHHGRGPRFSSLGQAEIEEFYGAFGRDLDVGGFEVTMDDAFLMRRGETGRGSDARNRSRFREGRGRRGSCHPRIP